MRLSTSEALAMILLSGGITFCLRALPFVVFQNKKKLPPLLESLANNLPPAIMAVLVVYCLKALPSLPPIEWLPALISVGVVTAIHLWKKNTLISVFTGTLCYMLLLQVPL
ncbi:MAG: branched-chain amino acid transporter AzlD [Clostridia bacterium]|nr:branched-chain amino acid transporter AzlD [Clostridia bacterium]NLS85146.1 branched-chain amino acid transporter AzlD [Oscillospiraceae bacterium]